MKTIEQENLHVSPSSLSSLGKLRLTDTESFFDDYSYSSGFSMNRNSNSSFSSQKGVDTFYSDTSNTRDNWVIVDDPPSDKPKTSSRTGINYTKFVYVLIFKVKYYVFSGENSYTNDRCGYFRRFGTKKIWKC